MKRIFILGSSSKWRQDLFRKIIEDFGVISPNINEYEDEIRFGSKKLSENEKRNYSPSKLVLNIARCKKESIKEILLQEQDPINFFQQINKNFCGKEIVFEIIIITADEVIQFMNEILEKPENIDQCRTHLRGYKSSNGPVISVTGINVAMINAKIIENKLVFIDEKNIEDVDYAKQFFTESGISLNVIEQLISKGDVLKSSGSLLVEDELMVPFLGSLEGELESFQGLPLKMTEKLIKEILQNSQI
ncbi:7-methyl-gtp pyrophosphatase [Anaeramoeba ignava]|uniref:7-methyl-gtp pyrophosphatase n=1 Tax=Anaeramoeba ignava TaxID=1746090 RepID=A0A9Q0LJG8_ANAIG|nr:7-methyl-gtp pyrophosphatase [Anaeramoeba ignava]|eukprot:Anaeramoba_ignava/a99180_22.p1 GENE.a99180_22~~a99180_22.p1  ORF type:complete len:247 (-),score=75.91 a99180_22:2-742(-)